MTKSVKVATLFLLAGVGSGYFLGAGRGTGPAAAANAADGAAGDGQPQRWAGWVYVDEFSANPREVEIAVPGRPEFPFAKWNFVAGRRVWNTGEVGYGVSFFFPGNWRDPEDVRRYVEALEAFTSVWLEPTPEGMGAREAKLTWNKDWPFPEMGNIRMNAEGKVVSFQFVSGEGKDVELDLAPLIDALKQALEDVEAFKDVPVSARF